MPRTARFAHGSCGTFRAAVLSGRSRQIPDRCRDLVGVHWFRSRICLYLSGKYCVGILERSPGFVTIFATKALSHFVS